MENENKKFNGFMVFMTMVITILFVSLSVPFLVSFISALILVVILRACWLVYGVVVKFVGGISIGQDIKIRKKADK